MIMQRAHPFDVVARILSERLLGDEASDELCAMMGSTGIDWERVVGVASAHFVLPASAAALRDLGPLKSLDDELGAFLETVHAANMERNAELRVELAAAVKALNRAGIEPVLLKGAIRLADRLYPDDGWRMLRDLDLLVPKAALAEAIRAFEEDGYALIEDGAFRRELGACKIELHEELFAGARQMRLLQAVSVLDESRPLVFEGATVRTPSIKHQLVHLIGHSQIRHCGHAIGRICLRDRLEAAALLHWGHEAIDWQAISTCFVAAGYRRPLLSFLLALSDGAWGAVPVTGRIDALTALQRRRIVLQARSRAFDYVGSRAGWWVSEFKSQVRERDAGQPRAIRNFKRLIFEPGAIRRMARAFWDRQRLLLHASPYLSWLVAQ
jgi:hypothetical protein